MLNDLWTQAMTISRESTQRLWDRLKPDEQEAVAGRHSAEADIITEAEMNVKELLGSKAEVLLGPESLYSFEKQFSILVSSSCVKDQQTCAPCR